QSAVSDQRAHAGDVAASRRGLAGEANSPGACLTRAIVSTALLSFGLRRVRRLTGIGGRPLRFFLRGADRDRRDGNAEIADSASLGASSALRGPALQERRFDSRNGGPAELCRGRQGQVRRIGAGS